MDTADRIPFNDNLYFELPEADYETLCRRASTAGMDVSKYTRHILFDHTLNECIISAHDLSKLNHDLDWLTFKISGYHGIVTSEKRISEEMADTVVEAYQKIADYLSAYYEQFTEGRTARVEVETSRIKQIFNSAEKTDRPDKSFSLQQSSRSDGRYAFFVRANTSDIESLTERRETAGFRSTTAYLQEILRLTRYIRYTVRDDDINRLDSLVYSAMSPYSAFLTNLHLQGESFKERERLLGECGTTIRGIHRAVVTQITNDRYSIYQKFARRTRRDYQNKDKNERRRKFKEERKGSR